MADNSEVVTPVGGVFKVRRPRVICSVFDCFVSAEVDVHMEVPDKFLKGITVPCCRKHADYMTDAKTLEYEEMDTFSANEVPL